MAGQTSISMGSMPLGDPLLSQGSGGGDERQSSSETINRPKRLQVKNACVNCQKACKKCDESRPCQRCIKYNLQDTCVDSKRKPRKRGVKRGPYKKRKKNPPQGEDEEDETETTAPSTPGSFTIQQQQQQQRRKRAPKILGPGSIPILHNDSDDNHDGGGSNPHASSSSRTLPSFLLHVCTQPVRLPPIESFDLAQSQQSPPTTSSLSILTEVALGRPPQPQQSSPPENDEQQQSLSGARSQHYSAQTSKDGGDPGSTMDNDTNQPAEVDNSSVERTLSKRLHDSHINQSS